MQNISSCFHKFFWFRRTFFKDCQSRANQKSFSFHKWFLLSPLVIFIYFHSSISEHFKSLMNVYFYLSKVESRAKDWRRSRRRIWSHCCCWKVSDSSFPTSSSSTEFQQFWNKHFFGFDSEIRSCSFSRDLLCQALLPPVSMTTATTTTWVRATTSCWPPTAATFELAVIERAVFDLMVIIKLE